MELGELIDTLEHEGVAFGCAAEKAGLDTAVPTCPEWTVRELVRHIGYVHRWAATYVREGRLGILADEEEEAAVGPLPDGDPELLPWFRDGHAALVATLRAAPPDLECWHFLPSSATPLQFWARRQAHETAIHRSDAQSAAGESPVTGVAAPFAVDGIDELLLGFYMRRGGRLRSESPCTLLVEAVDVPGAAWLVQIGPDGCQIARTQHSAATCGLRGPASELYLALWNRRGTDDLDVRGDRAVLDLWRERATVRWT